MASGLENAHQGLSDSLLYSEAQTGENNTNNIATDSANGQTEAMPTSEPSVMENTTTKKRKRRQKCTTAGQHGDKQTTRTREKKPRTEAVRHMESCLRLRKRTADMIAKYMAEGMHCAVVFQWKDDTVQVIGSKAWQDVLTEDVVHEKLAEASRLPVEKPPDNTSFRAYTKQQVLDMLGPRPVPKNDADRQKLFEWLKQYKVLKMQQVLRDPAEMRAARAKRKTLSATTVSEPSPESEQEGIIDDEEAS